MEYDIFFSISQTPVDGHTPNEAEMWRNFFEQVVAADELGYGVAWIAESHLSSEIQKRNRHPVIPHWQGEVGLSVDFLQTATAVFRRTRRIEAGSAIMNIVCNGGPVAAAERIAAFAALHGLDPSERRRIQVGFAYGRFEFINRASGVVPRSETEAAAWPVLKGKILEEAATIFLRLLRGDVLRSDDVSPPILRRSEFRNDADWSQVQALAGGGEAIELPRRWQFEDIKIVPQEWRRELVQPVIGSHDPRLQEAVNAISPVQVFNLSITKPEIIEDTHRRMERAYHPQGGPWKRAYMPRTVMVFVNSEPGLSDESRRVAAQSEAAKALSAYWTALEGTLDPTRVRDAGDNALIGNPADVAEQLRARFHPEDRLMLWFDFFNHDSARVIRNMRAFREQVIPMVEAAR